MTQLQCDITEYVIINKDEIKSLIEDKLNHLQVVSRIFDKSPDLYDELYTNQVLLLLRNYLSQTFNLDYETISLICDENFVKMTLDLKEN